VFFEPDVDMEIDGEHGHSIPDFFLKKKQKSGSCLFLLVLICFYQRCKRENNQ